MWITGLPASGKSTVTAALAGELRALGVQPAVLESDALRPVLLPRGGYDDADRDQFYQQLAGVGAVLVRQGVPVIFDATANRRRYREDARREIPRFLEVFIDCPLSVCIARDPKGIYRQAQQGAAANVPGLQSEYEPPLAADVVIRQEAPAEAARRIIAKLREKGYLGGP